MSRETNEIGEQIDLNLQCIGCQTIFTETVGEQAFYAERGFTPPKRCEPCAKARRAELEGARTSDWRRDDVPHV